MQISSVLVALRRLQTGSAMPGAKFYPNSTLNFAENCLAHDADDSNIAVISYTEAGTRTVLSWGELRQCVANLRNTLQSLGIGKDDIVAGFVSNGPEAVVASLGRCRLVQFGQVARPTSVCRESSTASDRQSRKRWSPQIQLSTTTNRST